MNEEIKILRQKLKLAIRKRNRQIVKEALKGIRTYGEIGKKYGLSKQSVDLIMGKAGVKVPIKKGVSKYERWKRKMSKAKLGQKYKKRTKRLTRFR